MCLQALHKCVKLIRVTRYHIHVTDSSQRNKTVITMAWPPVSESVLRVRLGVTVFCIVAVPRVTHSGLPLRRLIGYITVQNAAARLVTGARRSDHITPVLRQGHVLSGQGHRQHFPTIPFLAGLEIRGKIIRTVLCCTVY